MLTSLLLLLFLAPDDAPTWIERIRTDPDQAQALVRARDTAALESAIAAFFEAKDKKSLNALGWQAVAALPAKSEIGRRLEQHVLTSGLIAKTSPSKRYVAVFSEEPKTKPESISLEWETGSGHGFTFTRYRARWSDEGLRVRKMHYRSGRKPRVPSVTTYSTVISRRRAKVALRMVLAATALVLKKSEPAVMGRWSSSSDFHAALHIKSDSPVYTANFTGYHGSRNEPRYAALKVCNSLLEEALETCAWKTEQPNDADLSDLAHRLKAIDTDGWWVKERLILMVGLIGDKRCLPALKKCILAEPGRTGRPHRYAINAYARISGVDLRPKPFAATEVAAVRAKYQALFKKDSAAR